jgi:Na+/H+ antiporter NhaD/arsenite permease-like protein
MTLVLVAILILGFVLIATSNTTNVNKAAIAIFMGTVGWVLYIAYGTDFVMNRYGSFYTLHSGLSSGVSVKEFIARNLFLTYVGRGAEIVLFLIATMTIVEILNNNGCFDFITEWVRTRKSKRLMWRLSLITFILSANLDNLTTATMMLIIMHGLVPNRKQRMVIGCAIVLAANAGGCLTVIGDPIGLVLWNLGFVTASKFSATMALPVIVSWLIPTWLIGRTLPERIDVQWSTPPYRGDDTNLNRWQRFLMFVVGIGGLWFIPTFHNITKLSPFLGALCVLSVLWIVNEIFNRKLMNMDVMTQRRMPPALQYGSIQLSLFVMGIVLALGAVKETGAFDSASFWLTKNINNIYVYGAISGLISTVLNSFAVAMSSFSIFDIQQHSRPEFFQDGCFWPIIAYMTAMGSTMLSISSLAGIALMKMEKVHLGWFIKNFSGKFLIGWIVGIVILYAETLII